MLDRWITNGTAKPFYARKQIYIKKEVTSAVARVCGLGQFIFHVNGKKVGDHELDPAWTDYNKLVQYVTFDVTDLLVQGENVIGAEIGNGWYIKMDEHYTFGLPAFMPPNPNPYKPYAKALVLALELTVVYADGTEETLVADDSFKVKEHPTVMTNVYGSETIDNRLNVPGWDAPGYDDTGWVQAAYADEKDVPKGDLQDQFQPAVKVVKSYEGTLLHQVNGRDIYDFGQNMSGLLDFEIKGKTGDVIKIYPAEKLGEDGDVDQFAKNWILVDSCITAIVGADDVWEHCRMKFVYFAGRYMAVERVGEAEIRNLRADAVTSAYKTDGSFTCDDERYNQIYDMIEKTVEANMIGVHTDCPTIERFAWQEPNHLMASAIFYMKDGKQLWEKFLQDMRYGQHTADDWFNDMAGGKYYPGDGLMPAQAPCYIPNVIPVPGLGDFYDIIPWGSTCILGTYWHYLFYGDVKIIENNFDAGPRYLAHLKTRVNEEGFINYGLGDWGNPRNDLARDNIETAFLYADAVTLSKFAEILGKTDVKTELDADAEEIKNNYNAKLLVKNEELGCWCYKCWDHKDELFMTQASQALPLFWGLVPEDKEADIVKAFRYTLERDGSFICGEVGLPYVIQTARKYGMNDIICKYITKEDHPSYYAFVLDGETTLGEYWEQNPRSHCHDMMGHIIEWYYNGIAGIIPEKPGFGEVTIRPYLPESVHEFTCTYQSASGEIKVSVTETENEILVDVKCAEGIAYAVDTSNLEEEKNVIVQ
ncbi:MAG: family 78 glycoside hydrolase catalytic domain [Lachnospiraceae bacterium]|nr:family 78 glycoside hydrolase catalytic domain [Lachnospiraceae bacterium]